MVHEECTPISIQTLEKQGIRFEIFKEPRFTIYGELKDGLLFLHASPVKSWSPSTYKSYLLAMAIIRGAANAHGYDYLYAFLPLKNMKFATMMGFETLGQFMGDGEPMVLARQSTGER